MRLASLVRDRLVFYGELARATNEVGAFTLTSSAVARAISAPILSLDAPRRVLEVGPGTGALTRTILERLGAGDELHLCEINAAFARHLRSELGQRTAPRVEVFETDVAELAPSTRYDVIVSSLPLMNMQPGKVRRILELLSERLADRGTISYLDYWGKEVRAYVSAASERQRVRGVLEVTRAFLSRHEWSRRLVPWNIPPACVYHVRHRR